MNRHTTAKKGKRVIVIMHDNSSFIDRYVESKSNKISFEEHGLIEKNKIRSMAIYKNIKT